MIAVFLFVIGAMMGSFACCQAWRIKKHDHSKRSHCMKCKYKLRWYDNIPVLSWILLDGKCRKCKTPIGYAEILAEVWLGVVFVLTYCLWPNAEALSTGNIWEVTKIVIFLAFLVVHTISFVFDCKWKELPMITLMSGIGLGVLFLGINLAEQIVGGEFEWANLGSLAGALAVLPGLYYLLYRLSNEKWMGSGDWILNVSLALVLGDFWLAIFAMFLSNVLGCAIFLPVCVAKKKMNMKIPFGPFLITATWVIYLAQNLIFKLVAI